MDNHPIPQDVTGFQFKLIGNMTVKQFAYLATGVVFAWVLLQMPVNILLKFPFSAFSAVFGLGLAFFPVSGRPMDQMIGNYIKALIRPTQFIYEKTGGQIYFPGRTLALATRNVTQYKSGFSPFPKDKLKAYLESLDVKPKNKVDEKENIFLASVSDLASSVPQGFQVSQKGLRVNQETLTRTTLQPIMEAQPITPTPIQPVKPALKAPDKTIGMQSMPDFPNLITGAAKDPRGNPLPNILIEVKDKDGNSVRAFRTNEVGRFASATPIINGTYTIYLEDPRGQNKFEKITVDAAGQIIIPIEAISIDTREELRRSLFSPPAGGLTS